MPFYQIFMERCWLWSTPSRDQKLWVKMSTPYQSVTNNGVFSLSLVLVSCRQIVHFLSLFVSGRKSQISYFKLNSTWGINATSLNGEDDYCIYSSVCVYVFMCSCVCACVRLCALFVRTCLCVCVRTPVCACTCACVYACAWVCVCFDLVVISTLDILCHVKL